MERDIRETLTYRNAAALYEALRRPGSGLASDAVHISTDGIRAVFAGVFAEGLNGTPPSRICSIDLTSGDTRVLTFGPGTDLMPTLAPDGRQIAFLSDRAKAGDFQLYVVDLVTGDARSTPRVDGWVEYLQWSPDGERILLGVAGHGADVSGAQGAVPTAPLGESLPSWMPVVETGEETYRWRRAWIYELASNRVSRVGPRDVNVWEAAWCGNRALVAIASDAPAEGLWYSARLVIAELGVGSSRDVYKLQGM